MQYNMISLKKYDMFLVKESNKVYEITPLDGEKITSNIFIFNVFKRDFVYFSINESYLGKYYIFLKKSELDKMKIELFVEGTFKHSIFFFINYNDRKLYKFFFPILRKSVDNEFITYPDFKKIDIILNNLNLKTIIKVNSDTKEIIKRINEEEIFLDFCSKHLEENEYDEARLLWEIL